MAVVTVEEVQGRPSFKRFVEFPWVQFRHELRWSPPVVATERARLDPHSRYFDEGDGEYFLARRAGAVAGRIAAHISDRENPRGRFGFFDAIDDAAVVAALVERAATWLREHGCTAMSGPEPMSEDDDIGLLVEGFAVAGTTGRPWHPPYYAQHLEAAGLQRGDEHRTWRLTPLDLGAVSDATASLTIASSKRGAKFGDPRLVFEGIEAVPDLTPARGSALTLARRARRHDWEGCTIVRIGGDPAALVPQLCTVAFDAGYEWVVSPWTPVPHAPPETVHARFAIEL